MGDIATDGNLAFRDYVTDGVPASGAHAVAKADVRDLFALIDALVYALQALGTTAAAGLVELATDAEAQAKAAGDRALTPANLAALAASTSFAGLVELATTAEAAAGSSGTLAVTPAGLMAHKGVAKAWAWVSQSGGTPTLTNGYNITSITDAGVGLLTITIATDFANANWVAQATPVETSSTGVLLQVSAKAAGSVTLRAQDDSGSDVDPSTGWNFVGFGDQ